MTKRTAIPHAVAIPEIDNLEPYCNRTATPRAERELTALLLRAALDELDALELADLRACYAAD